MIETNYDKNMWFINILKNTINIGKILFIIGNVYNISQ